MPKEAMSVKHTKRGMNKLIKNIYLLQMNYVSVGIHSSDNKITSSTQSNKEWKTLQRHSKKMENGGGGSQSKGESGKNKKKSSGSSRKRNFNLATLAHYLEQPASWIQNQTVNINGVFIYAGARLTRPARIFISIFKIPNIWNSVRVFIENKVKYFYVKQGFNSKKFWGDIGQKVQNEQQNIIRTSSSKMNSELTTMIKGFNHPLFHTGRLLNAIKFKVERNYSGNMKLARLNFLKQMDEEMKKLE